MKRFATIFGVTLLACSAVSHAVPIRVLPWDNSVAGRKLSIAGSKGILEIPYMHPTKRSEPIQVTGGETPPMLVAMDRLDADGKALSEKISIPSGMKSPLLILLPDGKSPIGLRQLLLEDNTADFQWGSIRLVNATGRKLVFKWEKKLAAIPASWSPTDVKPGGANRNMGVQLFLAEKPDPPLYSAIWEQREEFRNLVFLVPGDDPRLGPVAFKTITEDRRVQIAEEALRSNARDGNGAERE